MASELTLLVCTSSRIRYPDQVSHIRRDLIARGFTATDETIQRAYEEWSEDYWASSWDEYNGQSNRIDELLADYLEVKGERNGE